MRTVEEIRENDFFYERTVDSSRGKKINFYPMMLPVSGGNLMKILKKEFPDYSFDELEINTIAMCGISIFPLKDPIK